MGVTFDSVTQREGHSLKFLRRQY